MILITGGLGLIGSNLISRLNSEGISEIINVDSHTSEKAENVRDLNFLEFFDKHYFREQIRNDSFDFIPSAVIHMGACSDTTEQDFNYLMDNNFRYSQELLNWCLKKKINFIYASSASVYGVSNNFQESKENESPINFYAESKLKFDNYVRELSNISSQVTGLRFFNVFGPNESHKGRMASTVFHFYNQIKDSGEAKLFKGTNGISNGEQLRDFIYVKDCVSIILWFLQNKKSGIFNVGTGHANNFNSVAQNIIEKLGFGKIKYIDFPKDLLGSYQNFTQANLLEIKKIGLNHNFLSLKESIFDYIEHLEKP